MSDTVEDYVVQSNRMEISRFGCIKKKVDACRCTNSGVYGERYSRSAVPVAFHALGSL
jgi:hypothetical protein